MEITNLSITIGVIITILASLFTVIVFHVFFEHKPKLYSDKITTNSYIEELESYLIFQSQILSYKINLISYPHQFGIHILIGLILKNETIKELEIHSQTLNQLLPTKVEAIVYIIGQESKFLSERELKALGCPIIKTSNIPNEGLSNN